MLTRDRKREMKRAVKRMAADLLEAVACRPDVQIGWPLGLPGAAPAPVPVEVIQEVLLELRGARP